MAELESHLSSYEQVEEEGLGVDGVFRGEGRRGRGEKMENGEEGEGIRWRMEKREMGEDGEWRRGRWEKMENGEKGDGFKFSLNISLS